MLRKITNSNKISSSNLRLIKELMGLAVEITLTTEHDIFVEWCGHIDQFKIQVSIGGWESEKPPHQEWSIYLTPPLNLDNARLFKLLRKIKLYMLELKDVPSN